MGLLALACLDTFLAPLAVLTGKLSMVTLVVSRKSEPYGSVLGVYAWPDLAGLQVSGHGLFLFRLVGPTTSLRTLSNDYYKNAERPLFILAG